MDAVVIGGGPAGLMAADVLSAAGASVLLAEAKPSIGRKLLMAGKSGLNLTRDQDPDGFLRAYGASADWLAPMIAAFGPAEAQAWARGLGQDLFTGSTGRVFPVAMKASPLLRSWLQRLAQAQVQVRTRWRWTGWDGGAVTFDTPDGPQAVSAPVTILTLGGASWARLGSDGAWTGILAQDGVALSPFQPANAALSVGWSAHMTPHFGVPLKNIALHAGSMASRGEVILSARGIEGGGIYPLSPALRNGAGLVIDLLPDLAHADLVQRLSRPRGKASLSTHLRKTARLGPEKLALLNECARPLPGDPETLAARIKALAIPHQGLRPMDEAISTAGGVARAALTPDLMLRAHPGVYVAGEMLDWEAPTGGYLLTGCLATGKWAGTAAARQLGLTPAPVQTRVAS
ncbi:MAG: TIGR03862 family flavoprotein [Marinibacterium sp.]|nr:TIGR03862 family flavoprotein [Marinibacterium sp.]